MREVRSAARARHIHTSGLFCGVSYSQARAYPSSSASAMFSCESSAVGKATETSMNFPLCERRTRGDPRAAPRPQIVAAFPFLWGEKQEQTATWHSLLDVGRPTAMTDALSAAWGRPPADAAPRIAGIGIAADEFPAGGEVSAGVDAQSSDGSALKTEWTVWAEATDLRLGGDEEVVPPRIPVRLLHADARSVRFVAPAVPGAYRLFANLLAAEPG